MPEQNLTIPVRAICPSLWDTRNRVCEKTEALLEQWQEVEDALKILSCDLELRNGEHTEPLQIKLRTVIQRLLDMEGNLQHQCRSIAAEVSRESLGCPNLPGIDGRRESTPWASPRVLLWAEFLHTLQLESGVVRRYGSVLSIAFLQARVSTDTNSSGKVEQEEWFSAFLPAVRSCDIVGRLGRDQCVVLFPQTTPEQAVIAIRRFQQLPQVNDGKWQESGSESADNWQFTLTQYRPEETPVNALKRLIAEVNLKSDSDGVDNPELYGL